VRRAEPGHRRPRWVYDGGREPDYRFSFANERTFLAWIRTSVALLAGGVAVNAFDLSMSPTLQRVLSAALALLALTCAGASWVRWARAERAMRREEPLPASGLGALLVVGLVLVALTVVVGAL
jgi:putative membrane protein